MNLKELRWLHARRFSRQPIKTACALKSECKYYRLSTYNPHHFRLSDCLAVKPGWSVPLGLRNTVDKWRTIFTSWLPFLLFNRQCHSTEAYA